MYYMNMKRPIEANNFFSMCGSLYGFITFKTKLKIAIGSVSFIYQDIQQHNYFLPYF